MTQSSRPQADNQDNGFDDAGPYSRDQWSERIRAAHTGDDNTASSRTKIRGVVPTYDNMLVPSEPAAGTVRVGSGAGLVNGSYLFNTADVNFNAAGDAPAANPRIDIVCLIENNTNTVVADGTAANGWLFPTVLTDYDALNSIPAYSARLAIVKGAEGAIPAAPALDQSTALYMVELARYQISILGVISNFADNREFCDIEYIVGVEEDDDDTIKDALILGTEVNNGAADDGLGVAIQFKLEDDAGTLEDAARLAIRWDDASSGTENSRIELYTEAGGAENLSAVIVSPTGASVDGNARGAGAVDLQQQRDAAADVASGANATIGGGYGNRADGDYSVVAGGGGDLGGAQIGNHVDGNYGAICGGIENYIDATATYGFVGGGRNNSVNAADAAICGGRNNDADDSAFVGAGVGNDASGAFSAIGAGNGNVTSGSYAAVPGGDSNDAAGDYSLAAGRRAHTGANNGVFVWGDSTNADVTGDNADQFKVRANGGAFFQTTDAAAALPVITYDQADNDEPFVKVIGDAAAANLTRNLVDEGDQGSETRAGWYKIEVLDDGNQITDGDYYVPFYSLSA